MNPSSPSSLADPRESRERQIIFLLCLLAAAHVFIFSAAFPFFNNVDEQIHFDLTVKYAQGHVPRALETLSHESVNYIILFGSHEYIGVPTEFPGGEFPPPPWTQPLEKIQGDLAEKAAVWRKVTNYEASQPPLYYSLGGLWWHLGKIIRLEGGQLLYWLRFLNLALVATLVWLGYCAARLVFPENYFVRIGVPALIAFMPQTAFYSIQNDVLSPVCFGAAFIFILKFLREEIPAKRDSVILGLLLAATFLTKISSLPLLAMTGIVVAIKVAHLARTDRLRPAIPSIAAIALCAGIPMLLWLAWCKYAFGDFSGTAEKIHFLGWTHKPIAEWWHHPLFTLTGLWTFLSGLIATLWQGEFMWHHLPLSNRWADLAYAIITLTLLTLALLNLLTQSNNLPAPQSRTAIWFSFGCVAAAVAFLALLSLIYDFQDCFYPSRAHPYFTSGRLMLGALIPIVLLLVSGLDWTLRKFSNSVKFSALAGIILLMLATETAVDWPVFTNAYNWFHL